MSSYENDRAFESVLQNTGNVDKFVDEFFSFLARRTDFFVVSPNKEAKIGFPPGIAAKLIITKFKKWESFRCSQGSSQGGTSPKLSYPEAKYNSMEFPTEVSETEVVIESDNATSSSSSEPKAKSVTNTQKKEDKVGKKKDGFASEFNSHNGRKSDTYSWSQSIKDLDVFVVVGEKVKTKRDVQVEISTKKIVIKVPSRSDPILVDWTLSNPIRKDESYWSLHPGESVFLSLQKVKEKWWDHVFEGEDLLDRNEIEAVRPMEDLDDEEQVKIHELVWNQEQKMKGLPTSEEMKLQEIMKKAWNAEGSPFKDQPYDPSLVQLANNTTGNFPNTPP